MTALDNDKFGWILAFPVPILIHLALGVVSQQPMSAQDENASARIESSKRMVDGKQWTTHNLNVTTAPSWCYENEDENCQHYGRLYTWESAQQACRTLGDGWRLPTDQEWRVLAKHHGGVSADSPDRGHAAYVALLSGGSSGFNAVLGGGRAGDGEFARLDAHGFYWTATETGPNTASYYNFGRGGLALHRQPEGEKERAFAVRCVRE